MDQDTARHDEATASHDTATPRVLSEDDAWQIAMAWRDELQSHVRLVTDRDSPVDSIIERYAWVRIETNVPMTRVAMLTWTALSSCPGFRGTENPSFWKRLFSELQVKPSPQGTRFVSYDETLKSVTDAYGFFDAVGHTFPRFMVQTIYPMGVESYDALLRELFTLEGPRLDPILETKLQSMLTRLRPFQRPTSEPIDVCLCIYFSPHDDEALMMAALVRNIYEAPRHMEPLIAPAFRIRHFELKCSLLGTGNSPESFMVSARTSPIRIAGAEYCIPSREMRAQWVRAQLQPDGHGLEVRRGVVSLTQTVRRKAILPSLMSALPFAQSVHSFKVRAHHVDIIDREFEQDELPWLAYAIFHPQACHSSWRHLEVEDFEITERSGDVFTAMARGNNLIALLNGAPPECDMYYSAILKPETTVYIDPIATSEALCTSAAGEGSLDMIVDVCGITSADPATWEAWVAVIVPAYGLGYVRKNDLTEIRAQSPSNHSSFGLHLHPPENTNLRSFAVRPDPESLLHVVSPLGSRLTYLNIRFYPTVSFVTLRNILRSCTSLKVLVASHNGEIWGDQASESRPTQLEELELFVQYNACVTVPSRNVVLTTLPKLRALRILAHPHREDQAQARNATLKRLLETLPALQYVHWRTGWLFKRPIAYAQSVTWTSKGLDDMGLSDASYRYADGPILPACAAAFISVIEAKQAQQEASALARIDERDVLATIFQLATSRIPRVLVIEPSSKA